MDDVGKTMSEIVDSVKRAAPIMGEISASSREQSTGVEQVNQAITLMDEITQQNAALVEQAAGAAATMKDQADHLSQLVGTFKLMSGGQVLRSRPAAKDTKAGVRSNRQNLDRPAKSASRLKIASRRAQFQKPAGTGGGVDWEEF